MVCQLNRGVPGSIPINCRLPAPLRQDAEIVSSWHAWSAGFRRDPHDKIHRRFQFRPDRDDELRFTARHTFIGPDRDVLLIVRL